jgi:hypothetical protein
VPETDPVTDAPAELDGALLDLSAWPAQPAPSSRATPAALPVPRRRRRPRITLRATSATLLALGAVVLLVPTPGCGPGLVALLRDPVPVPADTPPVLDDAQQKADAEAVRQAEAELAAWRAPAAPRPSAAAPRTVVVSSASAQEVSAAQDEVRSAERQQAADQAELDRVLARQEQADDPGAYDGQVAAAREQLDASVARLEEARHALSVARTRTVRVTVTPSAAPSAAPSARPTSSAARAALVAAVSDARQAQAAHLAARQAQLTAARADQHRKRAAALTHNAELRACARRSAVPVPVGLGLVLLGAAGLVRHRLTV